jgi:uncharacterized membrane protein
MRRHALLLAVLVACGDGGGSCPNDQPASCPATVPSYAADIAPAVDGVCGQCHAAGGVSANKPLDTYANLFQRRGSVLGQLVGCLMPPKAATQLTPQERADLLAWLVCGAPNN